MMQDAVVRRWHITAESMARHVALCVVSNARGLSEIAKSWTDNAGAVWEGEVPLTGTELNVESVDAKFRETNRGIGRNVTDRI
jgi:hypothetical protein